MKKWNDYEQLADLKTQYGAFKEGSKWVVNLWHPFAKNVSIIIYDKDDQNKVIEEVKGEFKSPNWTWEFSKDLDGFFYHYNITQEDGTTNLALDPFAKSMAAFNWEGTEKNVGKAAFVDFQKVKQLNKLNKINEPQPILYEAHVRDLTSLRTDVKVPGSYNALKEIKFAEHLKNLNITHVQFLPIHNCYTLDENDKTILGKGDGKGWNTNYNWGYDPHNYFTVNGWYSTNPNDPYSRMNEFKDLVKYMHTQDINVVVDVVYNHIYDNSILHNVIPGYYFRPDHENKPVGQPAVASERKMVRRIIVDSLKWFVEAYDVDGFRFDLSCYTDRGTIEVLTEELRKIKPNIVLHGEAWPWSDLPYEETLIKGHSDNKLDFAYFSDTTRNAIKGEDDGDGFALGIIGGNMNEFGAYLSSIVGNLKTFNQDVPEMSTKEYDRYTDYPNLALNYSACHDGHTMWDKINLTVKGDKVAKFEYLRQAMMMQQLLPGRTLYLEGTELLYTKPNDVSGQDHERAHKTELAIDLFDLGTTEFNENTYKTTDYSNGLRWEHYKGEIVTQIGEFMSELNKFRISTPFFNVSTKEEINNSYKFNLTSKEKAIIDFEVKIGKENIRVIHNFSNDIYEYESTGKIILDNKINDKNAIGKSQPHSSIVITQ